MDEKDYSIDTRTGRDTKLGFRFVYLELRPASIFSG